jgi:cytochrome P450
VIAERRDELLSGARRGNSRMAFLDLLLEMVDAGQMPLQDVQAEVDTFMFEGHDTTSTTLTWTFHLIACNPHVLQRCQVAVSLYRE